ETSGTLVGVAGDVVTNGCTQYIDYTFTITDDCGNQAVPVVIRVSRHYDMELPVIVDSGDIDLQGCNTPWPVEVTTSWSDNCGVNGEWYFSRSSR
ncbi:hypothetical protein NHF50_02470, partial [Flavobacterium sp. NRK F10]|uniref:hypothetical protein n=1 Tax=Flavobacterium sp. NRK F10 TaxID=2954931 RepID=UPI002090DE33